MLQGPFRCQRLCGRHERAARLAAERSKSLRSAVSNRPSLAPWRLGAQCWLGPRSRGKFDNVVACNAALQHRLAARRRRRRRSYTTPRGHSARQRRIAFLESWRGEKSCGARRRPHKGGASARKGSLARYRSRGARLPIIGKRAAAKALCADRTRDFSVIRGKHHFWEVALQVSYSVSRCWSVLSD